jgi:hypothetical protein
MSAAKFSTGRPPSFIAATPRRRLALTRLLAGGSLESSDYKTEYHGNPVDGNGALVAREPGCQVHEMIADWASRDVRIACFADRHQGLIGDYKEVAVWRNR